MSNANAISPLPPIIGGKRVDQFKWDAYMIAVRVATDACRRYGYNSNAHKYASRNADAAYAALTSSNEV